MEAVKKKWNNLPLRRFFILTVCISIVIVALLSAIIISGCAYFRHWLLPDPNAVYLTVEEIMTDGNVISGTYLLEFGEDNEMLPSLVVEYEGENHTENHTTYPDERKYSVNKIEKSFDTLSPKRKLAYQIAGVTMVAAPAILAFVGIILCSMVFYRRKLKEPLRQMADATTQIANQNLDFEMQYDCDDEMGDLCRSFENMRAALYENNRAMWNMLEERKLMQASIAHDLRNPIAIIEGYTEYLEEGLKNSEVSREKIIHIAENLNIAAKRLEKYTESVRFLNQSEEAEPERKSISVSELMDGIMRDLSLMAEQNNILLREERNCLDKKIQVDADIIYRILENIVSNALRYAKTEVCLAVSLSDNVLTVMVEDDGGGFPSSVLENRGKKLILSDKDGHMGIGLSISRLLCRKHGGGIKLSNTPKGACVKIFLAV